MAKIETCVELDKKEVCDAVIAAARAQLKESIGSAKVEFQLENADVSGAHVVFGGRVRTE